MSTPLAVVAVPPPYGTRPIVIAFIVFCVFILVIINILRLVLSSEQRHRKSFRGDLLWNIAVGALLLGLSAFFIFADRHPDTPATIIGMFILFVALVAPVTYIKVRSWRKKKR